MTNQGRWLELPELKNSLSTCPLNADWLSSLNAFPRECQDVYFMPQYSLLYTEKDARASCFVYQEGSDVFLYPFLWQPVPGLTGFFDISTAYGYGGPIATTTEPSFFLRAYATFRKEAVSRGAIAELIRFHPILNNQEMFRWSLREVAESNHIKLFDTCPTVHVDTFLDEQYRWGQVYTHANRKTIQKAQRNGIEIRFSKSKSDWDAFHSLYRETMAANQATSFYYFSDTYYKKIEESLADQYILAVASLNNEPLSVMILLLGTNIAHCHRIGTKRETMRLGVNNLLHHETILWAKSQGIRYLLIGGGRGNSDDDSLLQFKKSFSNLVGRFYIGESILNEEKYREACKIWNTRNPEKQASSLLLKYRA